MGLQYIKRQAQPIATVRRGVQAAFLALNAWIGVQFYLWVRYFESGGAAVYVPRPPGVEGLLTTIRISIAGNGVIIDADITRRSGNAKMDDSAMQAVRSVKPGPLPEGVRAPYALDVEFDASGVSV